MRVPWMRLARWRGKRSLERSGDGRWMIEAEVAVWVPERVWKTRARGGAWAIFDVPPALMHP